MKKVSIVFIVFLLMINSVFFCVNATEASDTNTVAENVQTENTDQTLIQKNEVLLNTYGKIIEVKEVRQVVTGTVKDTVQEVTVEITEGDYIGEEYTTDYILSYDIEGKILAHELEVGDKVTVQIIEDEQGNTTATVLDVVRHEKIIILFVLFLASVLVIGGKKGLKAIFGLLFTILIIYFVMIKGIFKGSDAIKNAIFS